MRFLARDSPTREVFNRLLKLERTPRNRTRETNDGFLNRAQFTQRIFPTRGMFMSRSLSRFIETERKRHCVVMKCKPSSYRWISKGTRTRVYPLKSEFNRKRVCSNRSSVMKEDSQGFSYYYYFFFLILPRSIVSMSYIESVGSMISSFLIIVLNTLGRV